MLKFKEKEVIKLVLITLFFILNNLCLLSVAKEEKEIDNKFHTELGLAGLLFQGKFSYDILKNYELGSKLGFGFGGPKSDSTGIPLPIPIVELSLENKFYFYKKRFINNKFQDITNGYFIKAFTSINLISFVTTPTLGAGIGYSITKNNSGYLIGLDFGETFDPLLSSGRRSFLRPELNFKFDFWIKPLRRIEKILSQAENEKS